MGPLLSLKIWGLVCPCCENSENKSARASLEQLNRLGTRIIWDPAAVKQLNSSSITSSAGGFMQSIFGRSNSSSGGDGVSEKTSSTFAKLVVVDAIKDSINSGEPYPEIHIVPQQTICDGNSDNNVNNNGPLQQCSAMSFQLDIPLHHVVRVENINATSIVIYTKDFNAVDENKSEKKAAVVSFQSSDDRDAASLDVKILLEWNQQRNSEGFEDDLPASGIRHRAQKAAHFAKREIEMREKKRDRERRKQEHMSGMSSGGLKYTAIAMANQVN